MPPVQQPGRGWRWGAGHPADTPRRDTESSLMTPASPRHFDWAVWPVGGGGEPWVKALGTSVHPGSHSVPSLLEEYKAVALDGPGFGFESQLCPSRPVLSTFSGPPSCSVKQVIGVCLAKLS